MADSSPRTPILSPEETAEFKRRMEEWKRGYDLSWHDMRRRLAEAEDAVAALTEDLDAMENDRDVWKYHYNHVFSKWQAAEARVAVLETRLAATEERSRAWHDRVAVLEAGLRGASADLEWIATHDRVQGVARTARDRIDALLGRVPAAAPEPDAWAPEIQEWAIINRGLTAAEQDRVYKLARSGTPIVDALRTVAQEGDTVTEGPGTGETEGETEKTQ